MQYNFELWMSMQDFIEDDMNAELLHILRENETDKELYQIQSEEYHRLAKDAINDWYEQLSKDARENIKSFILL